MTSGQSQLRNVLEPQARAALGAGNDAEGGSEGLRTLNRPLGCMSISTNVEKTSPSKHCKLHHKANELLVRTSAQGGARGKN